MICPYLIDILHSRITGFTCALIYLFLHFDLIVKTLCRMGLKSSGELLEDKLDKQALQKGFLLEFKKDSERVLLSFAQRPDGKKNWMVSDQVLVQTTAC